MEPMKPTERLRSARGYGRTAEQAIGHIVNHAMVVPSVKRDQALYADLAIRFLEWTADLLEVVDGLQTNRPSCRPVVETMSERVGVYFETKSRWPAVPFLLYPLHLMIPASYALRAVERVNSRIRPRLLTLDTVDIHDFVGEILGRGATLLISQHKNDDLRDLRPLVDSSSGATPLPFPGLLSPDDAARLADARADPPPPSPQPTVVVSPVPAPPALTSIDDAAVRARVWTEHLSGLRIYFRPPPAYTESYGGHSHHRTQHSLDLFASGRYREETTTTVRVFGPTVVKSTESWGSWRVDTGPAFNRLVLTDDGGEGTWYRLPKSTAHDISLDGERVRFTRL